MIKRAWRRKTGGIWRALLPAILLTPFFVAPATAKVLSVDHCADQYALALLEQHEIAALSPDATSVYSYHASRARGLPRVRAEAEALYVHQPSLVIRSWGGGFKMAEAMRRLDVSVLQLGYINQLEDVRHALISAGEALGREEKAAELVADFDTRLERARERGQSFVRRPVVLYLTSGGFTATNNTFIDEMIRIAGGENLMAQDGRSGFRALDLEALVRLKPDLVVTAFFDLEDGRISNWGQARHPVLRRILQTTPSISLPTGQLACSAWFNIEIIEAIQSALFDVSQPLFASDVHAPFEKDAR